MFPENLYFVLLGLVNGESGVLAIPSGSGVDPVQADGWYFIPDGEVDGKGPYPSWDEAIIAAGVYAQSHKAA